MSSCSDELRSFIAQAQALRLKHQDNPDLLAMLCVQWEQQAGVIAAMLDAMLKAHDEVRLKLLESEQEWHRLFRETKAPHHFVPSMKQIATTHGWELKGLEDE